MSLSLTRPNPESFLSVIAQHLLSLVLAQIFVTPDPNTPMVKAGYSSIKLRLTARKGPKPCMKTHKWVSTR
ncbi:MAG: hypothetical protein KY410_00805, partial [Proteobacteria bacterium]|nr:hypothetical protein [Pseudomonadota bacterium]